MAPRRSVRFHPIKRWGVVQTKAKIGICVAALAVIVAAASILAVGLTRDRTSSEARTAVAGDPETPPYPDDWKTTLQIAKSRATFDVIVPDAPLANTRNITAVYIYPENVAVAMDFPPPAPPGSQIRQEYIEVWEARWTGGDPVTEFKADIADDPNAGYTLIDLGGVTALGVNAHSPSDDAQANPAFLRFVLGGIDVQISGGESLDALMDIARTMIPQVS